MKEGQFGLELQYLEEYLYAFHHRSNGGWGHFRWEKRGRKYFLKLSSSTIAPIWITLWLRWQFWKPKEIHFISNLTGRALINSRILAMFSQKDVPLISRKLVSQSYLNFSGPRNWHWPGLGCILLGGIAGRKSPWSKGTFAPCPKISSSLHNRSTQTLISDISSTSPS